MATELLQQYLSKVTESTAIVENISVTVSNVLPLKDDRKVILDTDKGRFFVWKDSIKGIEKIDCLPKKFKADISLIQKGEYINVNMVTVDLESLSKVNLVASLRLPVAL
jgi:hypothetical protein